MLANYLGENDFRNGLRYYLKKHSYRNTETLHLWQALQRVSGKPVAAVMKNWTGKPGYPVVRLKVESGKLKVAQHRFFSNPISAQKAKDQTRWEFPLNFKHGKANFGETGFYRTAYSKEMLAKLRIGIKSKKLGPSDRLGIVRDLFALSESGDISTLEALEFLSAYQNESDYTVWVELLSGLGRLEQLLAETSARVQLDKFILKIILNISEKLGWKKRPVRRGEKNEKHSDTLLRSLILSRAGESGHAEVITEARKKFKNIVRSKTIDPDVRGAVYKITASHGDAGVYQALVGLYQKEPLHEEKNRIGNALGYFRDERILRRACRFAVSKSVRPQDCV